MRIGVDLGGTKIEAIALHDDGRERLRLRVPTPRDDYHGTLTAIVRLVRDVETRLGSIGTVGVGMPGALSPATGLVKNANSIWLNGRPFGDDLPRALGRPVRFANDANCLALSEATDGAARGATVVFGVILGTGTGGGIVVDGRLLLGPNAIAGEWGHNPLPGPTAEEWPGPACYCGRLGCIETFLSGPALAREFARARGAGAGRAGATERLHDDTSAADVAALAAAGDATARQCLDIYVDRLARALSSVVNLLDPDVIVLGGGVSNIDQLYAGVPQVWGRYVFSDRVDTRLVRAEHGDSSGVRGAAWLWPADAHAG